MPPRTKRFLVTLAISTTMMVVAAPAHAAITATSTASVLATAIAGPSAAPTGSAFVTVPGGTPNGVGDSALAGFPTDGTTFGILTTGDVNLADDENTAPDSGVDLATAARGAFDVSILKIDLTVPANQNCLRVDFRFLSEEFPEFVGGGFNDGFIAELDTSDWAVDGSTISAPHNFAFDQGGNVISINQTGVAGMSAGEAAGTTYDGATPRLVAQTPITAGAHSVYFSIFDAGDHIYDSAVFLDNLALGATSAGGCQAGAFVSDVNLSVTKTDAPDPVTAGEQLRYSLNVANAGTTDATNVEVVDQLPAGTTYIAAAGTNWTCLFEEGVEGPDTVTCDRATVAAGSSAPSINIDVMAPATADTITINNVADVSSTEADTAPTDNHAEEATQVQASDTADAAATFCASGCTLDTDPGTGATQGDPTVTYLIVPENADPQTVTIAEFATTPTFCGGSRCNGQLVKISEITGEQDPDEPPIPIIAKIVFDKTVKGGTQIYIQKPPFTSTPQLVKNCTTPGVASPHPCVSSKIVLPNGDREITVLLLFGDPILGKK